MNRSFFWERLAKTYSKSPVADEDSYRKKLEVTRTYLQPHMELLEFGCGTGSTAIAHAPYVKHIRATDISANMIDIAQGKAKAEKIENITFERSAIDQLSVADQSIDAVLGLSILHLLDNRQAVIGKAYRMLKPDGVFVTSTTCLGRAPWFYRALAPIFNFLGLVVIGFTVEELQKNMVDGGFEIDYQWQPSKDKAVFMVAKKA